MANINFIHFQEISFIDSELFFSIIRIFFHKRVLMTVGWVKLRERISVTFQPRTHFSPLRVHIWQVRKYFLWRISQMFQPRTHIPPLRVHVQKCANLSMGFISSRSTYGSAKRITAIFNSYTPWLDHLQWSPWDHFYWSPMESLFESLSALYLVQREVS